MYTSSASRACFPAAARYAAWLAHPAHAIREGDACDGEFPWSERHLRCVWADAAYRPAALTGSDGRRVVVEYPGRWNLEAGPDFLDAILALEPGGDRLRGDIELHVRPADWHRHGHAADPRYGNVIAHVTYFAGSLPPAVFPAAALQLSLFEGLKRNPLFSFDGLDVLAYPYSRIDTAPPCAAILASWPREAREAMLDAAGAERLRRKAERLAGAVRERGAGQVLYEETLCALGYKHNRGVCRALSHRVPLEALRREAREGGTLAAYALLCGAAGLLPDRPLAAWSGETRRFVRRLWDTWWKKQASTGTPVLTRDQWVLHSLRPQNHPLRRLMAAVELFCGAAPLPAQLEAMSRDARCGSRTILRLLEGAGMESHWAWHRGLDGPRLAGPLALIGPGRAAALLNNVVAPWLTVLYPAAPLTGAVLETLPAEDDNQLIRHTAHALFGHDHNPSFYRTGRRQQGLLQLFHDFCLGSPGRCRTCALPAALVHQKP